MFSLFYFSYRSTLNITYDVDNPVKEQSDPLNVAFIDNDLGNNYYFFILLFQNWMQIIKKNNFTA